jgi:hypothetical protein
MDQSGGVVAAVKVTLTSERTAISRSTTSGADGGYLFDVLPAGTYKLTVEHPGFRSFLQTGVVLEVYQNGRLDVTLQLGETSATVEVKAEVPQVDTTGAVLGKVESERRLQDLPILDRENGTLALGLLQAGVFAPDPDDGSGNPFGERPAFRIADLLRGRRR